MYNILGFEDKIGILDPNGVKPNPLTGKDYSQQYKNLSKKWSTFPAYKKAKDVLESIANNQITMIISGTGSGKSVLIPKFALHYTNYQGKIGMTLPKKVVTVSAAMFAAETMDVELGQEMGYIHKGSPKNMVSDKNKMVYMTDGVLIMKFVKDPTLSEFKVIIIDEAHERKIQIDLIMLFLKKLILSGKRPDLKIIIMSATIDGEKYKHYFLGTSFNIINISGQPNHEIKTIFLEKETKTYMSEGLKIMSDLVDSGIKSDMLFFITTSNEAIQLCKNIRPKYPRIYCIEVYADMDQNLKLYAESRDKFLELGNYDQKFVMATNVAESSLTIDGLKYVIDSCYELYSHFDPYNIAQTLEKRLITKAQALQRRGRVGRTEPGICYHLLTKKQFDVLENFPAPDILRQDITMDFLKIISQTNNKTFDEGYKLMNELMDPPKKPFVDFSKYILEFYNILDTDGKMTKIAHDIINFSSVPINRTLFLIYAYQLHCAKEASIIIAMIDVLNSKLNNLFFKADTLCNSSCEKAASKNLIKKLVQKKGDHLTFLNIFQEFKKQTDQKSWARKYGIRLDALNKADKESKKYYYKILDLSRAPQLSRIEGKDTDKKILEALKQSHRHLLSKNMIPTFSGKDVNAKINKESSVYYYYDQKNLSKKTFIYDELTNINGNWEFSVITLI